MYPLSIVPGVERTAPLAVSPPRVSPHRPSFHPSWSGRFRVPTWAGAAGCKTQNINNKTRCCTSCFNQGNVYWQFQSRWKLVTSRSGSYGRIVSGGIYRFTKLRKEHPFQKSFGFLGLWFTATFLPTTHAVREKGRQGFHRCLSVHRREGGVCPGLAWEWGRVRVYPVLVLPCPSPARSGLVW